MTSLGKRCHTAHLDAAEITVGFLSVASSNVASSIDFSETDLTTARLSTGAIDLGDYEVSAPSGGTFAIKDGGGSVRFALSSGGAFLHGYQPQLTVGGASIPDVVLSTFHLNLDDDPSLSNSLVTAGALSHYIENDLQPVLLTAPAGSQGGVRASVISLTTPSSLNVPSCKAVLDLLNNQESVIYKGLIATVNQVGQINTVKIPALEESISVNSTLIGDLDETVGELALSVANNYAGLVGVGLQIASINGEKIPALQESISVNSVLVGGLGETLSLNSESVGELVLSLGAARAVADHNTAKTNLLGTLYASLSVQQTTLQASITSLETSVSEVDQKTLSVASAYTPLTTATALQASITSLETSVSEVDQKTLSVASAYTPLTTATALQASITSLETSVSEVDQKTLSVASAYTPLTTATALQASITSLETSVSEVDQKTLSVASAYTPLTTATALQASITSLETSVSEVDQKTLSVASAYTPLTTATALQASITSLETSVSEVDQKTLSVASAYTPLTTATALQASITSLETSVSEVDQKTLSVASAYTPLTTATALQASITSLETSVSEVDQKTLSVAGTYTPLSVSNHLSNRISSVTSEQNTIKQTLDQVVVDVDELESVVSKSGNSSKLTGVAAVNLSVDNLLCAQFNNNRILLNASKVYHASETAENELMSRGSIANLISVAMDEFDNSALSAASANSASILSIGAELTSAQQAISVNAVDLSTSAEIVSELYLSVGDLATTTAASALSLGTGLDVAKNDIDTLEGVSSATLDLVISIGNVATAATTSTISLGTELGDVKADIADLTAISQTTLGMTLSVGAVAEDLQSVEPNILSTAALIYAPLSVANHLSNRIGSINSEQNNIIQYLNAVEADVDALQTTINTIGNATRVVGVAAINMTTSQNSSACARFKTDRVELLQDLHLLHASSQPTKIYSTRDIIFETPGGLYKDSVAGENEFLRKSDVDTLITQRLNAAFGFTNQMGLPSSTDYNVTYVSAGDFKVECVDSWNANFGNRSYAVVLTQKAWRSTHPHEPSMDLALHWYDKQPGYFRITHSEQEDVMNGTTDTPFDTSIIDFACFRQGFCFCSGSFYAFDPGSIFGPV